MHWLWSPTTDGSSCLIALSECESVLSLLLGEFSSAVWSWYLHWLTGVNTPTQDDIQVVAKYQGHLQMFSCGFFCVLTKSTKARARERKWERCSLSRHLGLIYTVKIIFFIRNVGLHEVCASNKIHSLKKQNRLRYYDLFSENISWIVYFSCPIFYCFTHKSKQNAWAREKNRAKNKLNSIYIL